MIGAIQRYRFTVDQYHQMGEVGILDPDCRVELIDCKIFEMSPIGPWPSRDRHVESGDSAENFTPHVFGSAVEPARQ